MRSLRGRKLALRPDFLVRYATEEKETKPASALAELLGREPGERPTAIVCYNDELAVRLLDVVRLKPGWRFRPTCPWSGSTMRIWRRQRK